MKNILALFNYTVDKWGLSPPVLRTAGAFFTTAQAVLHHLPQADSSPRRQPFFSQIPRALRAEF